MMGEVDAEDKDTTARTTTWGRSTLEQSDMMIFTCATNTTCHAPAFFLPFHFNLGAIGVPSLHGTIAHCWLTTYLRLTNT